MKTTVNAKANKNKSPKVSELISHTQNPPRASPPLSPDSSSTVTASSSSSSSSLPKENKGKSKKRKQSSESTNSQQMNSSTSSSDPVKANKAMRKRKEMRAETEAGEGNGIQEHFDDDDENGQDSPMDDATPSSKSQKMSSFSSPSSSSSSSSSLSSSSAASGHADMSTIFAQHLASNEKKTRDVTVRKLRQWLERRDVVTDEEMMKIFKGLFYTFWMSDKVPVQQELATRLSQIVVKLALYTKHQQNQTPNSSSSVSASSPVSTSSSSSTSSLPRRDPHPLLHRALLYLRCFFVTMLREWAGIDRLRLDKFMSLVRKFVSASFQLLLAYKWKPDVVDEVASIYSSFPLHPTRSSTGLFLHVTDVFLDELDAVLKNNETKRRVKEEKESKKKIAILQGNNENNIQQMTTNNSAQSSEEQTDNSAEAEVEGRTSMPFEAVESLLQPFFVALSECQDFHRVQRVRDAVFAKLLELCTPAVFLQPPQENSEETQQDDKDTMKEEEKEGKEADIQRMEKEEDTSATVDSSSADSDASSAAMELDDDPLKDALLGNSRYIADRLFECGKEKSVKSKVRKLIYKLREEFEITQFQTSLLLREMAAMDSRIPDMEFMQAITAEEIAMEMETTTDEQADQMDQEDEESEDEQNDDQQQAPQEIAKATEENGTETAQQISVGDLSVNGVDAEKSSLQSSAQLSSKKRVREQHTESTSVVHTIEQKNGSSEVDSEESLAKTSNRQKKLRKTTNVFVTPMKRSDGSLLTSASAVKSVSASASASKAVKFDLQGNQIQVFDLKQMIQPKESVNAILSKPTPTKGLLKRTNSPIVETVLKASAHLTKTVNTHANPAPSGTTIESAAVNSVAANGNSSGLNSKKKKKPEKASASDASSSSSSSPVAGAESEKKSLKNSATKNATAATAVADDSPIKATPKKLKFSDLEKAEEEEEKDTLPRSPRPRAEEFFDS